MEPEDKKFFEELAKGELDEPELNEPPVIFKPELIKTGLLKKPLKAKLMPEPEPEPEEEEFLGEEGQLTVDVYQTNGDIIVQSTVAGVSPDDLEINITPESVTIRGKRQKEERVEEKDYLYQECFWGRFSRSVILPQEIDPDRSMASIKNGVLTIRMPKLNRHKAKRLKVKFD